MDLAKEEGEFILHFVIAPAHRIVERAAKRGGNPGLGTGAVETDRATPLIYHFGLLQILE